MPRALGPLLLLALLAGCSNPASTSGPGQVIPPVNHGGPPPSSPTPGPSGAASPTPKPILSATPIASATPIIPPTPTPVPTPTFNPATVRIAEHRVPVTPLYVAAAPRGDAYFGFGAGGTGSNLYRYSTGALTQTVPAQPPSGYSSGGGVYGIEVTDASSVFWLSAYNDSSFATYVMVECGGSGGAAKICEPTVDEPTSVLVDASGTFWVAGLTFNGGGAVETASSNGSVDASAGFNTTAVMQIINGPDRGVWGLLQDLSQSNPAYSIAEFAVSGSTIEVVHDYQLPANASVPSMTFGGDGNFWFIDTQNDAIGRMTRQGAIREFPVPSPSALPNAQYGQWQITTVCDGSVWFTEPGANKIARIDSSGTINEFSLPTAKANPGPIAATARNGSRCTAPEIWVGEEGPGAIAAVSF